MRAAQVALERAGIEAGRVTHLVTVSCTGFGAPGIDAALIRGLGLGAGTQRTHVGFMGCHGALNGLRVARAFAEADPAACVLVCAVELCSLHFHYTDDPEKMVANALFADGAAAAIVGSAHHGSGPCIAACGSCLVPDSRDAMTWRIGDFGFEMTLSSRVPGILHDHLRSWLERWLGEQGLKLEDVGSWAVHPGGPRVLSTVAECLGLDEAALQVSREVLSEHGNMSSPTVLFILERLLARKSSRAWRWHLARGCAWKRASCESARRKRPRGFPTI
jgi:predicted naringenin-chalcone synthase